MNGELTLGVLGMEQLFGHHVPGLDQHVTNKAGGGQACGIVDWPCMHMIGGMEP